MALGVSSGTAEGPPWESGVSLLGHRDVSTTMLSTHVLNRRGLGVRSPADQLGADLPAVVAD